MPGCCCPQDCIESLMPSHGAWRGWGALCPAAPSGGNETQASSPAWPKHKQPRTSRPERPLLSPVLPSNPHPPTHPPTQQVRALVVGAKDERGTHHAAPRRFGGGPGVRERQGPAGGWCRLRHWVMLLCGAGYRGWCSGREPSMSGARGGGSAEGAQLPVPAGSLRRSVSALLGLAPACRATRPCRCPLRRWTARR